MKTINLVRHGAYENKDHILHGRLPLPLSDEGREQIHRVATYLKKCDVQVVYSSAVERCKQTSEIIADFLHKPIVYDKRLLEVLTVTQGMKLDEYNQLPLSGYQFVNELGGESMRDVQLRMMDFFYEKLRSGEKNIVVCSHGDPMYFLYCGLAGIELPNSMKYLTRSEYPPLASIRPVSVAGSGTYTIKKLIVPT